MKKASKIFLCGLLCASLALSLSACGGTGAAAGSTAQSAGSQTSKPAQAAQTSISNADKDLVKKISESTAEASGVCGADLYWYYKDNVLVIKGKGAMTDFYIGWGLSADMPWKDYAPKIVKLIIDEGCTEISRYAFGEYDVLSSVLLPNSLTQIDEGTFYSCQNLVSVYFGNGLQKIGDYAFRDCSSITSVYFSDALQEIGRQSFQDCINLAFVHFGDGLQEIGASAFDSCAIKSVILPDGLKIIGPNVFLHNGIETVYIPASVEIIGWQTFGYELISFDVDNNNQNFTTLDGVLFTKDMTELVVYPNKKAGASYEIPNGVITIGKSAFSYSDLESLTIPDGVITVGMYAFYHSNFESIMLPKSVTTIGEMAFYHYIGSGDSEKGALIFLGNAPELGDEALIGIETVYYSGSGFEPYIEQYPDIHWIGPGAMPEVTEAPEATATPTATEAPAASGGRSSRSRTVTDMKGNTVTIPNEVNTYVESWFAHNAVDVMLDGAEGMVVTCASPTRGYEWMYTICPRMSRALYTAFSMDMDLTEIVSKRPDVVFGSNENYREMFEKNGIAFVNVSFTTFDDMIKSVNLTAEVLGGDAPAIAKRYASYLNEKTAWVASVTSAIPEDQRPYIAHGSDLYALSIDGTNTIIDEWIRRAGGRNAASKDIEGNLITATMEQLLAWDPDLLITGSDSTESIMNDPAWQGLKAVQEGKVYANPRGIFAWDRYGIEEALQIQYAAQLLYPDLFKDFDLAGEVQSFYKDFLHYELSAQEARLILNRQLPGESAAA